MTWPNESLRNQEGALLTWDETRCCWKYQRVNLYVLELVAATINQARSWPSWNACPEILDLPEYKKT